MYWKIKFLNHVYHSSDLFVITAAKLHQFREQGYLNAAFVECLKWTVQIKNKELWYRRLFQEIILCQRTLQNQNAIGKTFMQIAFSIKKLV